MTTNDKQAAKATHAVGVGLMEDLLLEHGFSRISPHVEHLKFPAWSFQQNKQRRIDAANGAMPRDLLLRLDGDVVRLKVHHLTSEPCSSLYRSVAYLLLDSGPYLQVISGCSHAAYLKSMGWVEPIQSPLDPGTPAGIRHVDELVALLSWEDGGQAA